MNHLYISGNYYIFKQHRDLKYLDVQKTSPNKNKFVLKMLAT